MTTFLRLLEADPEQKGASLATAVGRWRSGVEPDGIFQVEPSSFEQVPGSPFAYWVGDTIRGLFTSLLPFDSEGRTCRQGLSSTDNFRFVRCAWEVDQKTLAKKWAHFAKGGAYAPYYADLQLVVNWAKVGREIKALICQKYTYLNGNPDYVAKNTEFYLRPGLTWTRRTSRPMTARPLPSMAIFSDAGPAAFFPGDTVESALAMVAIINSAPYQRLLELLVAAGDAAARQYDNGLIGRMPIPRLENPTAMANLAKSAWELLRRSDCVQVSSSFELPALLRISEPSLGSGADIWRDHLLQTEAAIAQIQSEIDELAFHLYGIAGEDRRRMEQGFGRLGVVDGDEEAASEDDQDEVERDDLAALTEALLEWTLGVALSRFDVRLATGERKSSREADPFDPLPVCSPGMLQDAEGLPAHDAPSGYPLELPPHGILVDDPGHPWDVVARMEAVFDVIAGDRSQAWIQEAESILGRELREWLRRYGFERHLKRYSRSRRKAPLFWHLAPKSRAYGVWLYSPLATRDTFYRLQNDYVDPKLKAAERRLLELRQHAGASPTGQQRRDLTSQESLVEELRAFREQVALIAPLWKPFRDDGVVLNCAVLSGLFDHHRAWQKECAKKWSELAAGKYDWAGWAIHLWPDRVVKTCASDRSIAIAHGMEEALWEEDSDGKWATRADVGEQIPNLIAERRSPAIEAALDAFIRAG